MSRMIDYAALWSSDKIAACAEWAQAEYAWLYGLADAYGSFELTNIRVLWGRVAVIRQNLSIERLQQIFDEFHNKGLLFTWEQDGKRFGYWTGSDRKGRLPPKSLRKRYTRHAPPVPKDGLRAYLVRFSKNGGKWPGKDAQQVLIESRVGQDRIEDGLKGEKDKPSCSSPSAPQEGFEAFWKAYPRHEDKARALRAWRKIPPQQIPAVLAGVERAKRGEQWQRDSGRYIPLPSSFLNGKRWEDEPQSNAQHRGGTPTPELPTVVDDETAEAMGVLR
jgi:hypothetical protein